MSARTAKLLSLAVLWLSSLLAPTPASACGGGFGQGLSLRPDQTLAIGHHDGVETYVMRPSFCGPAQEFGLVLPIAGALRAEPTLTSPDLFTALAALSAPELVVEDRCTRGNLDAGAGSTPDAGGTQVIGSGRVDVFEWVGLDSTSADSLTAWLDQNGFPYDAHAADAFEHYVRGGWSFVALKVAADALSDGGTAPATLCGSFGPIALSFESAAPVVPLRMAVAHAHADWEVFRWEVFVAAGTKVRARGEDLRSQLLYAGTLDPATLADNPTLATIARPGDRLTQLMLTFVGSDVLEDLTLVVDSADAPYRRTITQYREGACQPGAEADDDAPDDDGACSLASQHPRGPSALPWLVLAALGLDRRRRARARDLQ